MIELTLLTLLNYVGNNFCEYRDLGHDNYKSLLLSYSDASNKFGPLEVKKVIENSENFKVSAVAIAAIKCPQHIIWRWSLNWKLKMKIIPNHLNIFLGLFLVLL